jgi:HEAT repeats
MVVRAGTAAIAGCVVAALAAGAGLRHGLVLASFKPGQAVPSAASQSGDTPRIANGRVETRALTGPLVGEVTRWTGQAAQPQWMGYAVEQVAGDREVCCNDGSRGNAGCGTCRLESGENGINTTSRDATAKLEGRRNMVVLLRAENKRIVNIRVVSEECTLEAGGLTLTWLTSVNPAESVELLSGYVHGEDFEEHEGRSMEHAALTAIALHADAAADRTLESFVRPVQPEALRKQTAFWLGEARGKAGLVALQRMAKSDPSTEVRAQVTFALSVSREPGALDEMIRMAREDESAHVRGQALFWLAQKAGKKAVGTITGAIENDPDTEVKKKAVFALSQLPKEEGVPKLIEVAQNNRNPAVRKQAMFWLGQSNDPRALAFFEKVLLQ